MAEVSYLQLHENDDEHDDRDEVVVSFHPQNNLSQDLDGFDVYPSDLDWRSSRDLFCYTDRNPSRASPNDDHSILFDRVNQVNFVIDMFHQSVEQSQSRVCDLGNPDRSFRHGNEETDANDLGVLDLGFPVGVNNNFNNGDYNSGFMLSDCADDFFISGTTMADSSNPSEYFMGGFTVPDLRSDSDFHPEDDNDSDLDPNPNEDLEWEEIDDREALDMIFESGPDDANESEEQPNASEREVLLNTHNLEPNPDLADNNHTDNEMFFGQLLDNDSSSLGRPPASITAVENLLSVIITDEDFGNKSTLCAVCKDEIGIGLTAKQLPCDHLYHGDCIIPWLEIQNTCPVCRHELLTDDLDYERRKGERAARD